MSVSVVIRTKDEASRLRLVLASLSQQSHSAEIVVVDDGSSDHTQDVLTEAKRDQNLVLLRHEVPRGRSAASNAGARAASGAMLIFIDGDTLAHPDFISCHVRAHADHAGLIARGETLHLRCTRMLLDPDTGTAMPSEANRVAALSPRDLDRLRVTRDQVLFDVPAIERRAESGLYPGAGPRLLQEIELKALREHSSCSVLWAAASGSNQSVARDAFLALGGFHEAIDINEHRELALRLQRSGHRMVFAEGARSYHLIHRSGWRDPLQDTAWEDAFHAAHPLPEVELLPVFWASLSPRVPFAQEDRIMSLPELEAAATSGTAAWRGALRAVLGLPARGGR